MAVYSKRTANKKMLPALSFSFYSNATNESACTSVKVTSFLYCTIQFLWASETHNTAVLYCSASIIPTDIFLIYFEITDDYIQSPRYKTRLMPKYWHRAHYWPFRTRPSAWWYNYLKWNYFYREISIGHKKPVPCYETGLQSFLLSNTGGVIFSDYALSAIHHEHLFLDNMARRYGYCCVTYRSMLLKFRCNFPSATIKPVVTTIGEHWHDSVFSPFQTREVFQLSPQALSALSHRLHALRDSGSEMVLLVSILWARDYKR